jgi:hypothetical protein
VSLEAGAYAARWHGVLGRETREAGEVTIEEHGDTGFTAPFAGGGPAVLHLKRVGS